MLQVGHEAIGYQSSFSGVKWSANEVNHSHPPRINRAVISNHTAPTTYVFMVETRRNFHFVHLRLFTNFF
jgi:hypothetical protein